MPVDIQWMLDGRVMLITYTGQVSTAAVKQVLSEFVAVCDQAIALVHTISDTRKMEGIPPNVLGTMQMQPSPLTHSKAGTHIVVISNGLLRILIQTLTGLVPDTRFYCVRTLDEGWDIINKAIQEEEVVTTSTH